MHLIHGDEDEEIDYNITGFDVKANLHSPDGSDFTDSSMDAKTNKLNL